MEEEIFKRAKVNINKLLEYGFKKSKDKYIYECDIDNSFKTIICIDKNNKISGKVYDKEFNDEYLNFRTNSEGLFSNEIRNKYKNILLDILDKCYIKNEFIFNQTNRVVKLIKDKYNINPEFLWNKDPNCAVFRHKNNNKWFMIIMNIDYSKIDKDRKSKIEIFNIKLDDKTEFYLNEKGIYECYHMNKKKWVSVVLNDTLNDNYIMELIDISYNLTI